MYGNAYDNKIHIKQVKFVWKLMIFRLRGGEKESKPSKVMKGRRRG